MSRPLLASVLALLLGDVSAAWGVEETAASSGKRSAREAIDVFHLSKQPKLKKASNPAYPPAAADQGIAAEVTLLIDIDEQGEVSGATVAEPAAALGYGFDQAALVAAYGLTFEPAEIDGKPVAVQVNYKFKFKPPVRPPRPEPVRDGGAEAGGEPQDAEQSEASVDKGAASAVINLRGRILERGTRTSMDQVSLVVYREGAGPDAGAEPQDAREVTTRPDGSFEITDLASGRWTLYIDHPGYQPYRTAEDVRSGQVVTVTLYLERLSSNPYDVVVTAVRPRKEVSRTVIDHQVIEKVPGAAGDPLAVVQDLAGVARVPFGSGDIIVRGSAPRDTRIFVAGTEIPTAYHFGGLRSVLPVAMVESIDFYPGNFSPYYGRATGGIVDVSLKRLQPQRVGGYADVNLFDSGFFLEIPVSDHATIAVAARRSYVDTLIKAFFPSNAAVAFATAPSYYDYQLVGQYRPSRVHDLRFMYFGSDDRFALLYKQPADFDPQAGGKQFGLSTTFYRTLWSYAYTPSESFSNTLRVSQGRDWLVFGIGVLSFSVDSYTSQMRDTARFRFGDRVALSVGGDLSFLRGAGTIALPPRTKEGQPPANIDYSKIQRAQFSGLTWWSPAAFAELELRPWQSFLLVPGLRLDYFSRTDEWAVEPRLSARQNLSKRVVVKGGVGLFHQEPDFGEDYPGFGNPHLTTEKAWHYSAGAEWQVTDGLSLDLTLFYKSMFDLVSPTSKTVVQDGKTQPMIYDNGGLGRVAGVETLLRRDFSDKLTGWIAYTFSRSWRRDSGSETWRLFDFDQTHILTALGSYKLGRNWTLGGRFRFVSGNPRTPVVGSVVNASADRYEPLFGAVNSSRNPAFHQLDLRVDKRWVFDRWILDTYLDVQNVYNHRYAEGLGYSYDYSQAKPQSGLPILTIFGVRGEL
ncbi:MAG TPA: TonB family protein [Polyangia bacterium]|nr:TonB family protein [Polyangia bacterium]